MRRDHRQLAHYGAPVLFLLAVTVVVLILRGGFSGSTQSSATTSSTSRVTTTSTTSQRHTKTRFYTIRSGDTFGSIAIHFGVSVDDLTALNPGVESTSLRVGQKIKVGKAPAAK